MKFFHPDVEWLKPLLPQGIPVPSSTLLSGPGGSGKPLIASMILASWLKQGGRLIYFLINSDRRYAVRLLNHEQISPFYESGQIVFIDFNLKSDVIQTVAENEWQANLLYEEHWERILTMASDTVGRRGNRPMLFAPALNMLLFSPTYGQTVFNKIRSLLASDWHSLFTISNNVFEDRMQLLETECDNLFASHGFGQMRLAFRVEKMKGVSFKPEEKEVPLSEEALRNIRTEAEKARKHLIPEIRKM